MAEPAPFVIWGSSGHAKVLLDMLPGFGTRLIALFDNRDDAQTILSGVPVYRGWDGFDEWRRGVGAGIGIDAAIAIGGSRGQDRQDIAKRMLDCGLNLPTLIHPQAIVSPSARLGFGCHVLAKSVVAADAVLGNVCIINHNANVDHECVLGDGVHVAPGATLCGCISIGDNTLVGAGSVVLPRLTIGRNVRIGAGAVVTKNIPDNATVVGNPAVPVKGSGF